MMGEWGRQTYTANDTSLEEQLAYYRLYEGVSSIFDSQGMGLIKPWFTGSPIPARYTWSIFNDTAMVGTTERKYIVDIIARPRPLWLNGTPGKFSFNAVTRIFTMNFTPGRKGGYSAFFLPENRHYPDGFTLQYNQNLVLTRDSKSPGGLRVIRCPENTDPTLFLFDEPTQRLLVLDWPEGNEQCTIKVVPGFLPD
jgi:hypothetical protein